MTTYTDAMEISRRSFITVTACSPALMLPLGATKAEARTVRFQSWDPSKPRPEFYITGTCSIARFRNNLCQWSFENFGHCHINSVQ